MPCLNEAETIETCIKKAINCLDRLNKQYEIVVGDNGSTDGSKEIAVEMGAKVIDVAEKGYGAALIGAMSSVNSRFIIMGDSDDSYDFNALEPFIEQLENGYDIVIGNRFKGGISKNAMPFLHRYIGNPILSTIGRVFYNSSIGDFHCGLRGLSKEAFDKLDLKATGMEFASEMIVKSTINELRITEVPTTLSPDGRSRSPHLNTWRDGWRHLKFLFLLAPDWLFLIPGLILFFIGVFASSFLLIGEVELFGAFLDIHTLMYTFSLIIIGLQLLMIFSVVSEYGNDKGLFKAKKSYRLLYNTILFRYGLIVGVVLIFIGILLGIIGLKMWNLQAFGALEPQKVMRLVIPSVTSIILGFQVIFYHLMSTILKMK